MAKVNLARMGLGLIAVLAAGPASSANFTWNAGGGLWLDQGFWNPVAPLGGPTTADQVFITNNALVETITITQNAGAFSITLTDGGFTQIADRIILNNGIDFTFAGGGFVNDGHFQQNAAGSDTFVQFLGSQTIAGRGSWEMSDNANNRIIGNGGELKHGNGFGHEIRGAGQLLANTMSLWNLSTIRQQGSNALIIDPNANGVDNDGLLTAEGAGGLTLTGGNFDNTGGTIRADNNSVTRIVSSSVTGGTLDTIGTGEIHIQGNSTLSGIFANGTIRQTNGQDSTITNGLTNNGTWSLDSSGSDTFMQFTGTQTLDGNGQIVLSDNTNNRIIGNGGELTIGQQQEVVGAGKLANDTLSIVNEGTIRAVGATELLIDTNANGFDQNGTLEAVGAGGLHLQNSTYRLNNGVELKTGSRLLISNSTVTGSIDVAAGEQVELVANTLDAITVNGDTLQANSFDNNITNNLTNNGTWTMASNGSDTFLQFLGSQTLGGTGQVVMSDNTNNRIIGNGGTLTLGSQQKISGAGKLANDTLSIVNDGEIRAMGSIELLIDTNANGFDQDGVLEAVGSGGLRLSNSTYRLNNKVSLLAGSRLVIENSTVTGTIEVANGEQVQLNNNTLDGITVNGDTLQADGIDNTITNNLTNNGTWTMASNGSDTFLQFLGNQTLGGNGEVVMSDNTNNRIIGNGGELTLGAQHEIIGAGKLANDTLSFVNNGTIRAIGNNALLIDTNANGFDQHGVLEAVGQGGLRLSNSSYRLNNKVSLLAGSRLVIENSTVTGTIEVANGEQVELNNNTLDGITVNGDTLQANGIDNTIVNGITNNGTWTMASAGSDTFLQFLGSQTLGGNGELVMSDNVNNRLIGNGAVVTVGAMQTIRGAGQIGVGSFSLVNEGSIIAEGGKVLTIRTNANGFDQNGTLQAAGAGGLRLTSSTFRFNNGVELLSGSSLQIDSSTITGSIEVAAGEQVNMLNNTLQGVTINGDTRQANSRDNTVTGGLTNNGTWSMMSAGSDTFLQFVGAQTLGGNGEIKMSSNTNNRIIGNGAKLTIGADQTIRGAGQMGVNSLSFLNLGTVHADAAAELLIDANVLKFENQGTLIASGSGGLRNIGDLDQTAGQTIVDSTLTIQSGELELMGGTLSGSGVINGTVNNSGGSVNAGNSPGTLTINGDYNQSAGGELLIEIAGTTNGLFDVLLVNGTADLGGTINVALLNNPVFAIGQTFDVLIADSIVNAFTNVQVSAGGALFDVAIIDDVQDIVRLTALTAVPLPAPVWLMLSALVMLGARRRRS